jgi:hypothetical protein
MLAGLLLLASAVLGQPAQAAKAPPAAADVVYRIETGGSGVLWSADRPMQNGELVLFHEYPSGALMSVRRSDVRRVAAQPRSGLRSAYVDIGVTGGGARKDAPAGPTAGKSPGREPAGPGARKDGTALLNPDRKYQPDVDSKQVPGLNLAFPSSPNDYREGRTFAYPAAPAVQTAPGEPPRMPAGSGEVPKGPN